jgi:type IV secretion system protein VirB6
MDPGAAVVPSLASYVECQAQALGHSGFAGVGSALPSELLAACLTLFVALIGLRLLAGETFSLADATRAALRVGLVIVFSTSWTAYERVFFDVATQTPAALANDLVSPLGLRSAPVDETASGFQSVFDAVNRGRVVEATTASTSAPREPGSAPVETPSPATNSSRSIATAPASGQTPERAAGLFLMTSSLGGLLAMRLATGFLLAVGPIVITFGLFDAMVGLFVGWMRALSGVTLAALAASVVAPLQLDFLRSVVVPRAMSPTSPFEDPGLLVTSVMFTLVTLGGFWAALTLARGFHLRPLLKLAENRVVSRVSVPQPPGREMVGVRREEQPSRTRLLVDAIQRQGNRNGTGGFTGGRLLPSTFATGDASTTPRETSWITPQGLSQPGRRGMRPGKTMSATLRDSRR